MNNLQLYIAIGLPTFAVLASLIVSLVQISGVRDQISGVKDQISGIRDEIKDLRTDMREIRADIKLLTGKVYEMMAR